MKYIIYLILFTSTLSFSETKFYINGGMNLSKFMVDESSDIDPVSKNGYQWGIIVETSLEHRLSGVYGVMYNKKGSNLEYKKSELDNEAEFSYLSIPALLKYKRKWPLFIAIGTEVGYLVEGAIKPDIGEKLSRQEFSKMDFGLKGLVGLDFYEEEVMITFEATYGLMDIEFTEVETKISNFSIAGNVSFGLATLK